MLAARPVLALAASAALAAGLTLGAPLSVAHASPGETWSGFQVVHVVPAATTQVAVLGLMPRYKQGSDERYLWTVVRMVRDAQGHEAWVWCIQQQQTGEAPTYTEDPNLGGTPDARANAEQINRVLADSTLPGPGSLQVTGVNASLVNPAVNVLPARLQDHVEIAAVQLALWHYSEDLDFTSSNTIIAKDYYPASYTGSAAGVTMAQVLARYDTLVADADAHPLPNPQPSVTVTPASGSAAAGHAVTVTVTGHDLDGTIAVSTGSAGLAVHPTGAGGTCDTTTTVTSLPAAGATVCVVSPTARTVTVEASGASAPTTSHVLYAAGTQSIIAAAPQPASGSAQVGWTAPSASATPSVGSGGSGGTATPTPSASVSPTSTSSSPSSGSSSSSATPSPSSSVLGLKISGGTKAGRTALSKGVLASTGAQGVLAAAVLALLAIAGGGLLLVGTRRRSLSRTH